jgi:hypothetical protein
MRIGILILGGTLVLATAANGLAGEVNCKQVNKYLQTGRSAKDVAETMVISESDVEKCKAAGSRTPRVPAMRRAGWGARPARRAARH